MTYPPAEILIVDDNPNNLHLVRTLLTEHGYKVRLATGGKMALTSAFSCHPTLILLDVNMPDLNGYEVCKRLKADPTTKNIPIIFLSAMHQTFDKVQAFALGANDYVTKPFEEPELLARLNTHLTLSRLQEEIRFANRALEGKIHDLTFALRAAQALASNPKGKKLFGTILDLFKEASGASKGIFMINREGQWVVEQAYPDDPSGPDSLTNRVVAELSELALPQTLIEQVINTKETVVFNEWSQVPEKTAQLEYMKLHQPQSGLTSPIISGEQVIGVIYLEESQTSGQFTNSREDMVHLLCSQAANAIETARCYIALEHQLEKRVSREK